MKIKNLGDLYSIHVRNSVLQLYKPKLTFKILRSGHWFNSVNGEDLIGFDTPFFAIMYYPYDFWGKLRG
jgi:hypothetical protein